MPALDGGICRIKLACGRMSSEQARQVAAAAEACGEGVLELTNRSNLQLRSIRPEHEPELIRRLLEAGLGPRQAGADDVRNLLVSPAAGLDPQAILDVRPQAERLLTLLQDTPAFHALSPKFALQLDGGEALAAIDHPHDIWLAALPGGERLALGLAGCPWQAPVLEVSVASATELVACLLEAFLRLAQPGESRMRHLLARLPVAAFLAALDQPPAFSLGSSARRSIRPVAPRPGSYPQRQAGLAMCLAGAPLGRLHATQWRALAEIAEDEGTGWLHLTPWQGVLLPGVKLERVELVQARLHAIGLLTEDSDPLLRLTACSGSAGCGRGLADTKSDALRLAGLLPTTGGTSGIHLSGCPRSCAAAHVAPYTLLAQTPGHYSLYRRTQDAAGFGQLLATSIGIDEAAAWLAASDDQDSLHD
ncbi:precorrin-3B synthase [Pseudomonas sp. ABC1]|uniref:precorrin-3B synthase n=1 Tax=Pseudomonas sp. ABC1 TaxID=2748080 RepID=UPI00277D0BD4|nr:precorrin-3B synthase [Pseudomonas sp. ABC1]